MSVSRQNLLYECLSENTCKGHTAKIDAILDYYAAVDDEVEIRTVYRNLHTGRRPARCLRTGGGFRHSVGLRADLLPGRQQRHRQHRSDGHRLHRQLHG